MEIERDGIWEGVTGLDPPAPGVGPGNTEGATGIVPVDFAGDAGMNSPGGGKAGGLSPVGCLTGDAVGMVVSGVVGNVG